MTTRRRPSAGQRSVSISMPEPQPTPETPERQSRADALARLGIDRLVLSIHHASFPAGSDDLGHGTPASRRGGELLGWLAEHGFTGVALGPAGVTGRDNPSPYDATAMSRNPLHVALAPLVGEGLVDADQLAAAVAARPAGDRVAYRYAWEAQRRLLAGAAEALHAEGPYAARVRHRRAVPWIATEARFEAIAAALGHDDWRRWPDDAPWDTGAAWAFEVAQLFADDQHHEVARRAAGLGLRLYADLPVGISHRDRWSLRPLFLAGYAMGAPPSRTNPEGQPWDFPVLDPAQPAETRAFLASRIDRLLADHGGLRIDHPHGWVCPWVYTDDVQAGARLHESPDLADHPRLAAFARVRPDQLDRTRPRHDDAWVTGLEPAQIDAYAATLDLVIDRARAHGIATTDLMVEVLSTCPRPLAAVLARHGLGRFRVTQKAKVDDPTDVYRSDNAAPADWIMIGNHDTPPLGLVIDRWRERGELDGRLAFVRARLGLDSIAARDLQTALLAELFLGPARNVLVFWADLFGVRDIYNKPGVVDGDNWCLRVPADFEAAHAAAVARGDAPDLDAALAMARSARSR